MGKCCFGEGSYLSMNSKMNSRSTYCGFFYIVFIIRTFTIKLHAGPFWDIVAYIKVLGHLDGGTENYKLLFCS